jgi:hypothetical protein
LRREQIKLQVALVTTLFHVKGHASLEAKAAAEKARLLIEQAEGLGEPLEDPLMLFSVLFGFWAASYLAFNGQVARELAAQFISLAEQRGSPAHGSASQHGSNVGLHRKPHIRSAAL